MEIGRSGSNVCITADQWDTAMATSTFTAMATSLVTAAYPEDVLLSSNVNGGKSKINKNAPRYIALDRDILRPIKCKNSVYFYAYEDLIQNLIPFIVCNCVLIMYKKSSGPNIRNLKYKKKQNDV